MAATLAGTVGVFGVASAETGMIILDWEHQSGCEKVFTRTIAGSRKGAAFFDESIGIKVSGLIPSTTPFSGKIAATITLANAAATTHLQTASGSTILMGVTLARRIDNWASINLDAEYIAEWGT
jgi:hypothetical protein